MGAFIGSYRSVAARPEESEPESTSTECFLQPDGSAEGTADDTEEEQDVDLKQAIKEGDLEAVKEMLENRVDVNQRYDAGLTPLHFAVLHGHVGITRALVQAGGNVFAATTDDYKMTPMDLANAESNRPLFDALAEEPPTACASRQRFGGPAIIVGVILLNVCIFSQMTSVFHNFGTLPLVVAIILASVCVLNLLLVNALDPGAVEHDEVAFVQELRNLPEDQLLVHPPDSVATDESFSVLQKDSDSSVAPDVYRWCRSCSLWRLPNVSHCSACGRCFWRMDHHCFAVGNCVAARNHRFFVLMLLSGSAGWAVSIVYLAKSVDSGQWQDAGIVKQVLSIVYIVAGCLAMLVLLPFTCFHTAVLVLNVNTRMMLRPKKDAATHRRLFNTRRELRQLFCMPLRFRSGMPREEVRETAGAGLQSRVEPS